MSKLRRCKYLGVQDGERLARYRAYRCLAPEPEMPVLPASITKHYANVNVLPLQRTWVNVDYHCEDCPLYEKATS